MSEQTKPAPKAKEIRTHHGFRLPKSVLEVIRRTAEEKGVSQADVLVMWAEASTIKVLTVKPSPELAAAAPPAPPVSRLDKVLIINEGSITGLVHGLLHRTESHSVLRPSEEKGRK